jgi:hypothetical protein
MARKICPWKCKFSEQEGGKCKFNKAPTTPVVPVSTTCNIKIKFDTTNTNGWVNVYTLFGGVWSGVPTTGIMMRVYYTNPTGVASMVYVPAFVNASTGIEEYVLTDVPKGTYTFTHIRFDATVGNIAPPLVDGFFEDSTGSLRITDVDKDMTIYVVGFA